MNKIKQLLLSKSFIDENESLLVKSDIVYELFHTSLSEEPSLLDDILKLKFLDIDDFYNFIAKKNNLEICNLLNLDLHMQINTRLDTDFLREKLVVPISEHDLNIQVAISNPYDTQIVYEIMKRIGKNVTLLIARKDQVQRYINDILVNRDLDYLVDNIKFDLKDLSKKDANDKSNTAKLLELVLTKGIQNKASDIHVEYNLEIKKAYIRFRIDGKLYERFEFEEEIYLALSSTLKLFANIDFVNNTKAQDGRFTYKIDNVDYDFRISIIPLFNGESISIRILHKKNFLVALDKLGLSKNSTAVLDRVSNYPYGLVLVTGPTGSGKTTVLYSLLNHLNDTQKKVITVEDPVEYQLEKIQQIQVKKNSDIKFTSILKSILRHDPDVIMIGEVRDEESLKIAVESALTGHLVFTTLHTNDAISSIVRLNEMGVENYLIASSLVAVHSQRLVRANCQYCLSEYSPNEHSIKEVKHLLPSSYKFYYGKGCNECSNTGFSGRMLISESLFINQELSSALTRSANYDEILQTAKSNGFVSMLEDGLSKALKGQTSFDEVIKAIYT